MRRVSAVRKLVEPFESREVLSDEMMAFADHLAELLAAEFVRAIREGNDESSGVREVLERESEGAEH